MKNPNSSIPAFTLLEMVVVLALSGIVITLLFQAFHMIQMDIHSEILKNEKQSKQWQGINQLKKDIQLAESIKGDTSALEIQRKETFVHYDFGTSFFIRKQQNSIDTFFVALKNKEVKYLMLEDQQTDYLHCFIFYHQLKNEIFPITIIKEYSNERLYKFEIQSSEFKKVQGSEPVVGQAP